MISGLVEQKHIGLLHQGLGNGQAFAPAAGEAPGIGGEIVKAGTPQRFRDAPFPLCRRYGDAL
jgi:hypothetical protein